MAISLFKSHLASRRAAEKKLKFDLFDRRFVVYDVARVFISSIAQSGKVKEEETTKFLIGTREAKWLLNSEIANYFYKDLYHNALKLQLYQSEAEGMPVGPDRAANVAKQLDLKNWICSQYDVLDEKFSPFLQLEH